MAVAGKVLVVGFGIAGAMVAWQLWRRGIAFEVIDRGDERTASMAAAGVLNPVTGKRLVKTWMADEVLPFAKEVYREIEAELGERFLKEAPVMRVCQSAEEEKQWAKRRRNPAYTAYLGEPLPAGMYAPALHDENGIFPILQAGVLDLERFLPALRAFFEVRGLFKEAEFFPAEVSFSKNQVMYQENEYSHLILCQGWEAMHSTLFPEMAFVPAKGEILELRARGLNLPPRVIHREKWVLPGEGEVLKVGSTWGWERLDNEPTPQGESALHQGVEKMFDLPQGLEKVSHRAGVRPCTKDRRPFIGSHPEHPPLVVFNGFGSKGTFYAPWFANHLLEHLGHGQPLMADVYPWR